MNLIASPKSVLLLNAGLDVLHEQSNEWLSEIAFWRDETAFFYALVVEKTLTAVPIAARETIEEIENALVSLTGGELEELQKAVEQHENYLGYLLETNPDHDGNYREKHKLLEMKFKELERRFRKLKSEIFDLVKMSK